LPGRKKCEDEQGRGEVEGEGLLEELPRDRHVIIEADVRD
jgi:hypothetical protein